MQTEAEKVGYLWINEPAEGACVEDCVREATGAYQRARNEFETLILCGTGAGAAYCIMLAGRFSPDGVWIEPFQNGECESFFQTLRACSPKLFAVCARTEILLPEDVSKRDRRRLKRFLNQMREADKNVEVVHGKGDGEKMLRNRAIHGRIIKTLA